MTAIDDAVNSVPADPEFLPRPRSARAHVSATQPTGLPALYTPADKRQPIRRSS